MDGTQDVVAFGMQHGSHLVETVIERPVAIREADELRRDEPFGRERLSSRRVGVVAEEVVDEAVLFEVVELGVVD